VIYHQTEHGILYHGDCLTELQSLSDCSVDCCITSPPYWGLRDYGCSGQLGLEKTPEEYVSNMVNLFREVRRVLKSDGTLWLNLGDSYAGSGHGYLSEPRGKQVTNKGTNFMCDLPPAEIPKGLKAKDLVGIPWRVAFALQADGWYLRQDIIWAKPNPMPESVTDRCTKSHEYIFLLTKSARYYYDNEAIKEKGIMESSGSHQRNTIDTHGTGGGNTGINDAKHRMKLELMENGYVMRNKRSVWTVSTKPFKEAHFATFPKDLILPCVLTTRKDAVILDPFFGSGTTGVVAVENGRNYIGIDLNDKYCKMASERIETALDQTEIEI
jgi:DNA modification methylase